MIAGAIGLSIAWLVWTVNGFTLSDAHAYRTAAERLLAGSDLYQPANSQADAYRYAPWFAAAWIPIAALPFAVGQALWAIGLLSASILAVLPLARSGDQGSRLLAILGGTVLLWTTARGNAHPLVIAALVHGLDRRSGPVWVAAAASLKAVPILFVLVYVARREWSRVLWTIGLTAALVAPMPFLGWEPGSVEPGESISLYSVISPSVWAVVAAVAAVAAVVVALRWSRYAATAAAISAILALPRLLLYDLTYLLVGAQPGSNVGMSTGANIVAPGPS
jgi:glycosyl transferase family 87